MKSRALAAIGAIAVLAIGLLVWQVYIGAESHSDSAITKLTSEDLGILVESSLPPQQVAQLANDPEARKQFIEKVVKTQLVQLLALASEARKEGIQNDEIIKQKLEFSQNLVIARLYDQEQRQNQASPVPAPPFGNITKEEADEYLQKHQEEYKKYEELVKTLQKETEVPPVTEEQTEQQRQQWAKISITAEKARAEKFEQQPKVRLQLGLQQSNALVQEYAKKHAKDFEPTEAELKEYVEKNPQYDAVKQRETIEDVLKRAKAGEDFAALANQYSEDPGNKEADPQTNTPTGKLKGGIYENIGQGEFEPAFEKAALALEKGGISDIVETVYGFHVIKLEDKKTEKGTDGKEKTTFTVRHVLRQTKFTDPTAQPNPYSQPKFLTGDEMAKTALSNEKQKKFLEDVVKRNKIEVPEDFTVKAPDASKMPQPPAQNGMSPTQMNGGVPLPNSQIEKAPTTSPKGKTAAKDAPKTKSESKDK